LSSTTFPAIPIETVKAAESVFGKSNYYLVIGDQANHLFAGLTLEIPSQSNHTPGNKLAMLYLITVFQYIETLPDPLALNALDERVDWKYALHLPLKNVRMDGSALCEFRKRLLTDRASEQNLQKLLGRLSEVMQFAFNHLISLETDQVVTSVCTYTRLAKIWEAINRALETLATRRPDWLRVNSLPHWYERYGRLHRNLNLKANPPEQEAFAQAIGADGFYILEAISQGRTPEMANLPEISALRQIWEEQFEREVGKVHWRENACAGCPLADRLL
jgi:hypothetical protein